MKKQQLSGGALVRNYRMSQDLSQAQLAERAGVHQVTISRIEGGHAVRIESARRIAHAIGAKTCDEVCN